MPIQRVELLNGEFYHIVLRSVGDTTIFNEEEDSYRGIFSIYEFNTTGLIEIRERRRERKVLKNSGGPTPADSRDPLVEVLTFCFMPNHIHLLVKQLKTDGISQFMKKVGGGYATYFNRKYNRKGHLFTKFKAVHIKTNKQFKNVFVYIHCNPISLIEPGWKENGIENPKKVIEFLKKYKWSSYQDYIGTKNFPSVTARDFLIEVMGGEEGCEQEVEDWIKYKKEISQFGNIILE